MMSNEYEGLKNDKSKSAFLIGERIYLSLMINGKEKNNE